MNVDFLRPDLLADGTPHEAYRRLRDEDPVSWHRSPSDSAPGYWLLTRHADVHAASIDAATFSSYRGTTGMFEEPADRIALTRLILINMDPPSHTRYRRLISRAFAPRAIERLEPDVRSLCRGVVEKALALADCDFVRDIASPLPMRVIFALLDVPEADHQRLVEWSNDMIDHAGTDPALAAAMRMYGYSDELARARRARPGDDVVSALLKAEIDGERLTDGEFNAFFLLLVVAGNETTRNLIAGGLLALLEHPDQLALLRAQPSLLPTAVEEMLRFVSPIAQFRRTANRDVELAGRTIREGDKVILAHASANRDERVFADPDRFDVRRAPNPHLAFGVGPHLCIGAALARLEARVLFEELLPRVGDIERAGPTTRVPSNFISGLRTMPLRLR
jgi:cholest-4-en-3-one 26-monooxygenase